MRDFTLRAVSLSCKSTFKLWNDSLLRNLTISVADLFTLHQCLEANPDQYTLIKSLQLVQIPVFQSGSTTFVKMKGFLTASAGLDGDNARAWALSTHQNVLQSTLSKLKHLEKLVFSDHQANFSFKETIKGKSSPLGFFTNSLKHLHIRRALDRKVPIRASAVCWILCYCSHLQTAIFALDFTFKDLKFLEDHKSGFDGVSKIRELALAFSCKLPPKEKCGWWSLPKESEVEKKGIKTSLLSSLLLVTSQLTGLELLSNASADDPIDESLVNLDFLPSLWRSSSSLKQLRLINITELPKYTSPIDLSSFSNLKILSVDAHSMIHLFLDVSVPLPPTLETFHLIGYDEGGEMKEDMILQKVLQSRRFRNLKEVVVPESHLTTQGAFFDSPQVIESWKELRRDLESDAFFSDGKTKLRKVKRGEIGESKKILFQILQLHNIGVPLQKLTCSSLPCFHRTNLNLQWATKERPPAFQTSDGSIPCRSLHLEGQ